MNRVSHEECISALREANQDIDGPVSMSEYGAWSRDSDAPYPSPRTVVNRFGSWNEAKDVAGLTTYDPGVSSHHPWHGYGLSHKHRYDRYEYVRDFSGDSIDSVLVHRLIAIAEFGLSDVIEKVVDHKNTHRFDNRPSNLRLMDATEHNKMHALSQEQEETGEFR